VAKSSKGSKNLFKRGKAYYVRWRVDGKLHVQSTGETTFDAAVRKRDEILLPFKLKDEKQQLQSLQAAISGREAELRHLEENEPALLLAEAWSAYKQARNRPQSGQRTLERYEYVLTEFCKCMKRHFPEIKEMREVGVEHAEAYAHQLEAGKVAPSTFNIYLNNLSLVWSVLASKARITQNPFTWNKESRTGIQRKNVKAQADIRKKRALTLDEVNTVVAKAEGDYRTLLIILVCTGQRLVDGVRLKWREIDFTKGIIGLTPAKTAQRTGKRVFIPLLPQLRNELESKPRNDRYVLPALVAAYEKDRSSITKRIRKIYDKAKLDAHKETDLDTGQAIVETGAHSLRHSFVTIARIAGIPDPLIMQITGHGSAEMVDHYTDFSEALVSAFAAQMPQVIPQDSSRLIAAPETHEPLPSWATGLVEQLDGSNWSIIKKQLLCIKRDSR